MRGWKYGSGGYLVKVTFTAPVAQGRGNGYPRGGGGRPTVLAVIERGRGRTVDVGYFAPPGGREVSHIMARRPRERGRARKSRRPRGERPGQERRRARAKDAGRPLAGPDISRTGVL